jgi:hypothetical protein
MAGQGRASQAHSRADRVGVSVITLAVIFALKIEACQRLRGASVFMAKVTNLLCPSVQ